MDDLNLMRFHPVRIMFTIFNTHFWIDVLEMCIDISYLSLTIDNLCQKNLIFSIKKD